MTNNSSPRAASARVHRHAAAHCVRGFSLVELMVAMVVMAVVSSVAVASYRSFTLDARRAGAVAALTDAASRQEQFFLNNKTYTAGAGGINAAATVEGGHYALSIVAPSATCTVARCWLMQTTPLGAQAEDSCGTLGLNSDGDKTPVGCW